MYSELKTTRCTNVHLRLKWEDSTTQESTKRRNYRKTKFRDKVCYFANNPTTNQKIAHCCQIGSSGRTSIQTCLIPSGPFKRKLEEAGLHSCCIENEDPLVHNIHGQTGHNSHHRNNRKPPLLNSFFHLALTHPAYTYLTPDYWGALVLFIMKMKGLWRLICWKKSVKSYYCCWEAWSTSKIVRLFIRYPPGRVAGSAA